MPSLLRVLPYSLADLSYSMYNIILFYVGPPGAEGGSGATYTRWGRRTCPTGAQPLYTGVAAGTGYHEKGGTVNYLCMPYNPQFKGQATTTHYPNGIEAVEYILESFPPTNGKHLYEMPCAVCYITKAATFTQVGRYECPQEWTVEYSGYQMSDHIHGNRGGRTESVCVDGEPEGIGSSSYQGPAHITLIKSTNRGLPAAYGNGKIITCAVCSR